MSKESKNKEKQAKQAKLAASTASIAQTGQIQLRPLGQSTDVTRMRRRRLNRKFIIGMAAWLVALVLALWLWNR